MSDEIFNMDRPRAYIAKENKSRSWFFCTWTDRITSFFSVPFLSEDACYPEQQAWGGRQFSMCSLTPVFPAMVSNTFFHNLIVLLHFPWQRYLKTCHTCLWVIKFNFIYYSIYFLPSIFILWNTFWSPLFPFNPF